MLERFISVAKYVMVGSLLMMCSSCSDQLASDQGGVHSHYQITHNIPDTITAGMNPALNFEIEPFPQEPGITLSNAWGVIFLPLERHSDGYSAMLPASIGRLAGPVNWTLHQANVILDSGRINILPTDKTPSVLESYAGPSHIRVGEQDRASFVALPVDVWDNPLPDGTPLKIQGRFGGESISQNVQSGQMLAGYDYQAREQIGSLTISAVLNSSVSKTREVQVLSGVSDDFPIALNRSHAYADGHSLLQIIAGPIQDRYGNLVPDGTLVEVRKRNDRGGISKVQALSLKGFAEAYFQFPSRAEKWSIRAGVLGFGRSSEQDLHFFSAVRSCPIRMGESERSLQIGPVSMVEGGLVPDGFPCELRILTSGGKLISEMREGLLNGHARFDLNRNEIPDGSYQLLIQCGDFQWVRSSELKSSSGE